MRREPFYRPLIANPHRVLIRTARGDRLVEFSRYDDAVTFAECIRKHPDVVHAPVSCVFDE